MFKLKINSNTVTFFVILVLVLFTLYFLLNKSQEKFVEFLENTDKDEVKQKTRSCSQNAINNAFKGYVFTDYRSLNAKQ
jgi:predicted PurR-regulated permease PerM